MRRTYARRRLVALLVLTALAAVPALLLFSGGGGNDGSQARVDEVAATAKEARDSGSKESPVPAIATKTPDLVTDFDEPVPILMYHVIAEAPYGAANPGLFVPRAELEQQVRWLARKGYTAVTLSDLFAAWYERRIASKPVVL